MVEHKYLQALQRICPTCMQKTLLTMFYDVCRTHFLCIKALKFCEGLKCSPDTLVYIGLLSEIIKEALKEEG